MPDGVVVAPLVPAPADVVVEFIIIEEGTTVDDNYVAETMNMMRCRRQYNEPIMIGAVSKATMSGIAVGLVRGDSVGLLPDRRTCHGLHFAFCLLALPPLKRRSLPPHILDTRLLRCNTYNYIHKHQYAPL